MCIQDADILFIYIYNDALFLKLLIQFNIVELNKHDRQIHDITAPIHCLFENTIIYKPT